MPLKFLLIVLGIQMLILLYMYWDGIVIQMKREGYWKAMRSKPKVVKLKKGQTIVFQQEKSNPFEE